jgi:phosphatidylglycerol lysyltransferase
LEQSNRIKMEEIDLRAVVTELDRSAESNDVKPLRDAIERLLTHLPIWNTNPQYRNAERCFSVAAFEPRFIAAQSVALSYQNSESIAFVTFMSTDCQTDATSGVMRQVPGAPPYTMEFMFMELALELKGRNLKSLSLGMAPLAGITTTPLSSRWHRVAGGLWEHGRPIDNFRGLRGFKNKFRPVWESRYLATSGAIGSNIRLADVAALAGGHRRAF